MATCAALSKCWQYIDVGELGGNGGSESGGAAGHRLVLGKGDIDEIEVGLGASHLSRAAAANRRVFQPAAPA
jgi:hypothetical protein